MKKYMLLIILFLFTSGFAGADDIKVQYMFEDGRSLIEFDTSDDPDFHYGTIRHLTLPSDYGIYETILEFEQATPICDLSGELLHSCEANVKMMMHYCEGEPGVYFDCETVDGLRAMHTMVRISLTWNPANFTGRFVFEPQNPIWQGIDEALNGEDLTVTVTEVPNH